MEWDEADGKVAEDEEAVAVVEVMGYLQGVAA